MTTTDPGLKALVDHLRGLEEELAEGLKRSAELQKQLDMLVAQRRIRERLAAIKVFACRRPQPRNPIFRPPGHNLIRITSFIYPKRIHDCLFAQMVADEREEHSAALAAGRYGLARWIGIRCWLVGVRTMLAHAISVVVAAISAGRSLSK
jgi:hypothetical protein